MAPVTLETLRAVCPQCPAERARLFVEPLNAALEAASIDTPARVAAFLAQAAHESAQLRVLEENLNYSAERLLALFSSRLTAFEAAQLAGKPEAIANRLYGGRMGNGDERSGDGWRYRGRGIFQVTGRDNYRTCSVAICGDADTLLANPEFLTDPDYACMAAAWFWGEHRLNFFADAGDFDGISDTINRGRKTAAAGDAHGYADRVAYWKRAIGALA